MVPQTTFSRCLIPELILYENKKKKMEHGVKLFYRKYELRQGKKKFDMATKTKKK